VISILYFLSVFSYHFFVFNRWATGPFTVFFRQTKKCMKKLNTGINPETEILDLLTAAKAQRNTAPINGVSFLTPNTMGGAK